MTKITRAVELDKELRLLQPFLLPLPPKRIWKLMYSLLYKLSNGEQSLKIMAHIINTILREVLCVCVHVFILLN